MKQSEMAALMERVYHGEVRKDLVFTNAALTTVWMAVVEGLSCTISGVRRLRWPGARIWALSVIGDLFELRWILDGAKGPLDTHSDAVFADEINVLREAGQAEYAGRDEDAFANFMRIGDELGLRREIVLWVYAMKHRDGIANYMAGHRSQREDVRGRINDLIVYLFLLYGMLEEREGEGGAPVPVPTPGPTPTIHEEVAPVPEDVWQRTLAAVEGS